MRQQKHLNPKHGTLFSSTLSVRVPTVEPIARLGGTKGTKPRPVILNLCNFNEKMQALRNSLKFKGTNYSISEDFSFNANVKQVNNCGKVYTRTESTVIR